MFNFLRKTRLYILALPVLFIVLGAASNQAVLIANHDKFPVLENAVRLNRDVKRGTVKVLNDGTIMLDEVHCLMTNETHLNFLADIFDFGHQIESIGDLFIDFGQWLWGYAPFIWGISLLRKYVYA
jgi:hypothetical protein